MALKYTKEILENASKEALSISEVLRNLGVERTGSIHRHIKDRLSFYNIDTSHFNSNKAQRQNWKGGSPSRSLDEILSLKDTVESAYILRKALLKVGVEEKCVDCGLKKTWNNKPIRLQIDHKNGNRKDNRKDNLRFMCPNCHSQTPTYGAKNIKLRSLSSAE